MGGGVSNEVNEVKQSAVYRKILLLKLCIL